MTNPFNCSKCGRFIGKDGYPDVFYDEYNGDLAVGYSLCGPCRRAQQTDSHVASKLKTLSGSNGRA